MTAPEAPADAPPALAPSSFFVLRTPLLPLEEWLSWTSGLGAPSAPAGGEGLEAALGADRAGLRERLTAIIARPEVRDAIFVASPDLDESLDRWVREPGSERGRKVELSLVRYFTRMASRPTPFGLFAGCSTGTLARETCFELEPRARLRRLTRLDAGYLHALAQGIGRDPGVAPELRYRPNPTLYRAAGRLHYVVTRVEEDRRSSYLAAADEDEPLAATLARAREGELPGALATALVGGPVSLAEATEYVGTLIAHQLLVCDLGPALTGPEPTADLIAQVRALPPAARFAEPLERAKREIDAIDAGGVGAEPARYREVSVLLSDLPAKLKLGRLFQVDLVKPAARATLGDRVVTEIEGAVALLRRLARRPGEDVLARFREAFATRYERREVLLSEALDAEVGIEFGGPGVEAAPLLAGLDLRRVAEEGGRVGPRDVFLQRKVEEAVRRGDLEVHLDEPDLKAMEVKEAERPPLPGAFAVMASVAAPSEAAIDRGDFRLLLRGVSGPSGALLLGRFCHADDELRRRVLEHLRAEEALEAEAIFAEVVHLPDDERLGNILARPQVREWEIVYAGRPSVPPERQIPISDLLVSVEGQRVVLRSARLGREVIPRLTSAHNFHGPKNLPVYRFLCALQGQGAGWLDWSWGLLEGAAFLPRVVRGRLVLARARWRLEKEALEKLGRARGAELFRLIQSWRAEWRVPRLVALADFDHELLIDLENVLSIETFVHLVKGRESAFVVELFPPPDELCVRSPEGRFVHEIVVPFVRREGPTPRPARPRARVPAPVERSFPPGSSWLYVKLYTGPATADVLLRDAIAPLVEELRRAGSIRRWFFIRYRDPDQHLRLRFGGDPEVLHGQVLPAIERVAATLLEVGRLHRMQLDTYEREVERYGGGRGIEIAERIFEIDSEAALALIGMTPGDAGAEARWLITLRGIDVMLDDLGCDLEQKRALMREHRESNGKTFRVGELQKSQLEKKWRRERARIEALLDRGGDAESPLAPALAVMRERSERLRPLGAEISALEKGDELSVPRQELMTSFIHMHVNRMLRSAQREQELVLCDFLNRVYISRIARARGSRPSG